MTAEEKRALERRLRGNGFGQAVAKKIVALVAQDAKGQKTEEPVRVKGNADHR